MGYVSPLNRAVRLLCLSYTTVRKRPDDVLSSTGRSTPRKNLSFRFSFIVATDTLVIRHGSVIVFSCADDLPMVEVESGVRQSSRGVLYINQQC